MGAVSAKEMLGYQHSGFSVDAGVALLLPAQPVETGTGEGAPIQLCPQLIESSRCCARCAVGRCA
jgi:hypothetical protein